MILSSYREDSEKQLSGTPIYIDDATFYGRRFGTPESKKALNELRNALFGPLHKWTDGDDDLLLAHWLVEYGIVRWEGVYQEDGESELRYTKENARAVFTNKEYFLSLNAQILRDLSNFENFLYDAAEEDIENLKKN